MFFHVESTQGERAKLLQTTAGKTNSSDGSYESTVASVIAKLESGADTSNSSGAQLLSKIQKTTVSTNSGVDSVLSSNKDYTTKAAIQTALETFLQSVNALSATGADSLFLQSYPDSEEAREAFDISCSDDANAFTLDVKQLATAQSNVGVDVTLADTTQLSVGRNYFDLTMDKETVSLIVKVSEGDSNETVLNKIATAINNADVGVNAVVEADETTGMGHLELTSKWTGAPIDDEERVFYLTNQSAEDLVSLYGLNQVAVAGQDAVFNFNGAEEDTTYMYNSALIDDTVSLTFKQVTDGPISVAFDYDYDALSAAVEQFVAAFNELSRVAADSNYSAVQSYVSQMVTTTKDNSEALANVGLTMDADHTMYFNSGMLYQTDMDELKSVLNQSSTGYTPKIAEEAQNLQSYVDRLTGASKKYYGLRAKKSTATLRAQLQSV
jgi:flagellar hook-associated protein 2